MSNFVACRSTWKDISDEKRACFVKQGYQLSPNANDANFLRDRFEALCKAHKEFHYTKLFHQLQFYQIERLTDNIDELVALSAPDSLSALVSGSAFIAIECLHNAGLPMQKIVEPLGLLHSKVPQLGQDLRRASDDLALQKPLQEIFAAYIDALLCTIQYTHIPPRHSLPLDDIEKSIQTCTKKFQEGEALFRRLVQQARQCQSAQSSSRSSRRWSDSSDGASKTTNAIFKWKKLLGYGTFGLVDLMEETSTGELYARKQFHLSINGNATEVKEEDVMKEYKIMKRLWHAEHIAKVLFWYRDEFMCSIYMQPAADHDLRCFLELCIKNEYPQPTLANITPWFGCLLDALAYAHRKDIWHQDIKPNNILIKDQQVYLADFGLAKDRTSKSTSKTSSDAVCGTPIYRAPEIKPGVKRGLMTDVFSLGCVFSEMLTVRSRKSLTEYREYRKVEINGEDIFDFRDNLPKVNQWLRQLEQIGSSDSRTLVYQICGMLQEDANDRKGAQEGVDFLKSEKHGSKFFCCSH